MDIKSATRQLALAVLLISLFAVGISSQASKSKNKISSEEAKDCKSIFYDEATPIIEDCTHYQNYTLCLNNSGPNTHCSLKQDKVNFKCKTGELITKRNSTECKPLNKIVVSIPKDTAIEKKEIDLSNWGVCINSTENDCLAITCGSEHGGSAVKGVFNDCDGGKSCQKFLFCPDGTKVLYKASRADFAEIDPTFSISKLDLNEVGQ